MPNTPIQTVGRQLGSAARNQIRAAEAQVLRETGIVAQANARLSAALNAASRKKSGSTAPGKRKSGVYVQERIAVTAPDGYVRLSPVQEIKTAPEYKQRIIKRVIGAVIGVLIAAGIVALLLKYLL